MVATFTVGALVERVGKVQRGFTDIQRASLEIATAVPADRIDALAAELYASPIFQARMLAVFLYGIRAAASTQTLMLLRDQVSADGDWRVQEILAQAFDRFCKDTGYETALPVIESWLNDERANVRRAVTEGLRIWTARPYFKQHPEYAIALLARCRTDESDYVRRSAGNAMRDISRKHADLVRAELATWDQGDKHIAQVYKLAAQFLE